MKKYLLLLLLASFSVEAQIINIPDANFKAKLLEASPQNEIAKNQFWQNIKIDMNDDGEIQESELLNVFMLRVEESSISSLEGISFFLNLNYLLVQYNQLTSLNLSGLNSLIGVNCYQNQLSTLDVTNCFSLVNLMCYNNNLTSLDVSGLSNLSALNCSSNLITSLNLTGCTNLQFLALDINQVSSLDLSELHLLEQLNCYMNYLTSLDVSGLELLYYLDCSTNQLNYLNVSGCHQLHTLYCVNNNLTSLDVSDCYQLSQFSCWDNDIEYLNLKNGGVFNNFQFGDDDVEIYVCADDYNIDDVLNYMETYNIIGHVNSYCSFVPGREFFTIQGNSKLDLSSNGCDESDIDFPNMKFTITDGILSGGIISNTSGEYFFPVQEGTHTVTPVFENPTYFNVSPSNFSVSFPTETSPFTQNFCITPNGTHPDVEVVIVPLGTAIPGFDVSYKLVYKNKGNTTVSGSISFTFMDSVMDFVSSDPVQSMVEPNILNWNYTNLQPFETREIVVTFNMNSPQETPALNDGEILEFIAIIDPLSGDEMPSDNTSALNQEVVNSYDPNDKTCLEGSVVSPELIGQYVHYVIRFENTGTFFAQNVVVKDEIDVSKFDLNSLIVLSASHQQWTRINGNKVEFIFENIQLPFPPSEERHGYIAFKIKLKNNLTVGDTFSNFASIYFDYNFPIITEPATTSIEALSNPDFEFSSFVKLYPNPANSILTIESQAINLKSVEIFNSLGQLIQAIANEINKLNIDVSQLQTGTYFIKVNSDKGVGVSKFVKQ